MYVSMYGYVCACVCAYIIMYVCMYEGMYVCMYIHICMYYRDFREYLDYSVVASDTSGLALSSYIA